MAKDANPVADEPPKKSKKLLILIGIAVLVIGLAGAAAAFFLLSGSDDHDGEEEVAEEVKKPKKKKADASVPPVFVNLDAFTVNLTPEEGKSSDQYMQVVIALELEDMSADGPLKNQMPRIRNNLTMILSSKKASELLTKEGKEKLAGEIRAEINSIMNPGHKGPPPETPILSVLFTSFIIQ
ncbi:flagellar basal body-associated FliL family protein [Azovibrio restrictus]|uniref:flagellar basal body-associated FliL family protein n=1 Tax=Azovibrio restrictus TaxID=146938 RepID=UPI0026EE5235|nr:flagellar basal body-associated FliL family protein [Azovibrio restrictus]